MFVRVVFEGGVTEVMISDKGVVADALDAARVPEDAWDEVMVTGTYVCTGTRLRPDDVIEVLTDY